MREVSQLYQLYQLVSIVFHYAAIFTHFRAQMKHGVSEVHDGERHVGIIFHDSLT
jgi:hypothetical protein